MKTKFTASDDRNVTVEYDSYFDESPKRIKREFFCTQIGGYVREWAVGDAKQVCDELKSTGATLTSSGKLIDVIRREFSKMRREEKFCGIR